MEVTATLDRLEKLFRKEAKARGINLDWVKDQLVRRSLEKGNPRFGLQLVSIQEENLVGIDTDSAGLPSTKAGQFIRQTLDDQ